MGEEIIPLQSNSGEAVGAGDEELVDIEDGHTTKEVVLLKRLECLVGKEGPDGMKKWGGAWRNLIRVCPTAVRDAVNDTIVAQRGDDQENCWLPG